MLFKQKNKAPLVFVKDAVIFPGLLVELLFSNQKCVLAVESLKTDYEIVLVTQKDSAQIDPTSFDLYQTGVMGTVKEQVRIDGITKVLFESKERVKVTRFNSVDPYFNVLYEVIKEDESPDDQILALRNNLVAGIKEYLNNGKLVFPLEVSAKLLSIKDPNQLVNNLVPLIEGKISDKQAILESQSLEYRLKSTSELLFKALRISELEEKVAEKTEKELEKTQKEVFLREELKTIQNELSGGEINETESLRQKILGASMPKEIEEIALREFERLEKTPSFSPELAIIRNYLDWLIGMPWQKRSENKIDINEAEKILDRDHWGLQKVKERILEFLAVSKMVGKLKGPILCFVGPPGTGKTSIGKAIAEALGREFVRISLGGIHDEAEIRGHMRTYVGSMPGRILQGIHRAGTKNPVFMLDEIDKIGSDFRGDPSAALLEALDPEQNANFSDHYLEVPFDLSDVFFITTANVLDTIPPALRDRMEMIEFSSYTPQEKFHIAEKFILPKLILSHGLTANEISIEDSALIEIIDSYTLEAGVRNLERELAQIIRKVALEISRGDYKKLTITKEKLPKLIGQPKVEHWLLESALEPGLAAALAVTEAGGEILSIEAAAIEGGKGNLLLTGNLGDVMKESAQAAMSCARNLSGQYQINPQFFASHDIHVHVPRGAIPKDGPSAGIAIAFAILSALLGKSIANDIGMTGEITLRGRILKIGGLKEKVLAAKRAGLKKVIIPESNRADLSEIAPEYQSGLTFFSVKSMREALDIIWQ